MVRPLGSKDQIGGRPAVNKRLDAFWLTIYFSSIYQTNGTNRYRTFWVYSVYPGKFLCRNLSSSRSRHISAGMNKMSVKSPHHEPSATGVPISKGSTPAYIGWRTTAYGPVEMTVCPSATWIVEAA